MLVANGVIDGEQRGYLLNPAGLFQSDRRGEPALTREQLMQLVDLPGHFLTFTAVPPGTGERLALDRDRDGVWNNDEPVALASDYSAAQ